MMKNCVMLLVVLTAALFVPAPAQAGPGKVKKVLIQFLDRKGRHTAAPSLYERDAYQVHLREHPEKRSAICANLHWRAVRGRPATLQVEFRGTNGEKTTKATVTQVVTPTSGWARWDRLTLEGGAYREFGELISWRVTIWDGDSMVAEQKSFLW